MNNECIILENYPNECQPTMPKIDRILQLLEARIARGDYAMMAFPTETSLAEEMSVGRMTARRAILRLVEGGLLYRDATGRMAVTAKSRADRPLHIGFLTATLSPAALHWQQAAEQNVRQVGGHMRVITYFHWDDPTLLSATENFDGVFLVPPAESLPPQLADRLLKSRSRIVVLGADTSALKLRSIDTVSGSSVGTLLNHLQSLGHRNIAVLNTQPLVNDIQERLSQWQVWMEARGYRGECIDEPEPSYGNPMGRAYQVMQERLKDRGERSDTAVLCTTLPAALGLMRAANELGLGIGTDISVCTINHEGLGPFLIPTLTSTQMADPKPLLRDCVEWMAGGEWGGALLKRPQHSELFIGRSTGPAPVRPEQAQLAPVQLAPVRKDVPFAEVS
jgi:DNA-binding LacI/PurR family transcriptional regulator